MFLRRNCIVPVQEFSICGSEDQIPRDWVICKGSLPDTRGYTCGLWMLFHTLLARAEDSQGASVILSINGFISNLFGYACIYAILRNFNILI